MSTMTMMETIENSDTSSEHANAARCRSDRRRERRTEDPIKCRLYQRLEFPPHIYPVITAQGTRVTFCGDFRSYTDVGVDRQALIKGVDVEDQPSLEAALEEARQRYLDLVAELKSARAQGASTQLPYNPRLGPMARYHLEAKVAAGGIAPSTLRRMVGILKNWVRYFDNGRLSDVTVARLQEYLATRRTESGVVSGTTIADNTIRNELFTLSGLFETATQLDLISRNPVERLPNKPTAWVPETTCVSAQEAARLLDAAAEYDAEIRDAIAMIEVHRATHRDGAPTCHLPRAIYDLGRRMPYMEAFVAALLYTGGRLREVLGLCVEDLDFERKRVRIRSNEHRKLKRKWHRRPVEFWRPLRLILRRYLDETGITSGLVFPGRDGKMRQNIATAFVECVKRAGLHDLPDGRHVTRHTLRHIYATLMLQTKVRDHQGGWTTLDTFTVARRLGHRTSYLVETCYGHVKVNAVYTRGLTVERYRKFPAQRSPEKATMVRRRGHLTLVA